MGQIGTGRDGRDPGFGVEAETTSARGSIGGEDDRDRRRDEGADRGEKAIRLIGSYFDKIPSDPAFFFLNQWVMRSQKRFISLENVLNSLECI